MIELSDAPILAPGSSTTHPTSRPTWHLPKRSLCRKSLSRSHYLNLGDEDVQQRILRRERSRRQRRREARRRLYRPRLRPPNLQRKARHLYRRHDAVSPRRMPLRRRRAVRLQLPSLPPAPPARHQLAHVAEWNLPADTESKANPTCSTWKNARLFREATRRLSRLARGKCIIRDPTRRRVGGRSSNRLLLSNSNTNNSNSIKNHQRRHPPRSTT